MVMLFDRMKSQSVLEIQQRWLKRVKRVGREYDRIFFPHFRWVWKNETEFVSVFRKTY